MDNDWVTRFMNRATSLHEVWDAFKNEFMRDLKWDGRENWSDFFNRVCDWIYNHPELNIDVSPCDTEWHTAAMLVYIPHENEEEMWGTTVLYITQESPPVEFFLDADAISIMREVVNNIKYLHDSKSKVPNKLHKC